MPNLKSLSLCVCLAGLASSVPADEGDPPEGPYRPSYGLTGEITAQNQAARATVEPLLQRIKSARNQFMHVGKRRENYSQLDGIKADADAILSAIGPTTRDDSLVIRSLGEVGSVVTMLRIFQRENESKALGARLRTEYEDLRSAHGWNPVLEAYAAGAELRQNFQETP